ncbi:cobalt-precorrin-5B (C1)-methyltransferase [Dongia mobilis]|uniref:Cobalt-precorrin-5B C(1)-methyltransferase n=1 Tax=Dongia mobilis TaxID=578943 RepID=A0A4R6WF93_9PROT|nr:cobalt-precorrin-5B (C(1))-methyltransferase [Dongia mobilis]TDQ78506.1 cobalt-precorrin-5B (C1)-methyltransferase [Dongia mobilis]
MAAETENPPTQNTKRRPDGPLRKGWTTGCCATAATKAAFSALLTGKFADSVTITLPKGEKPVFSLLEPVLSGDFAEVGIIKDAGDDPDVTHGAHIRARVRHLAPGSGTVFRAGAGVGTVTKAGLPIPPGEPAINPAPRAMIEGVLEEVAAAHATHADAEVTISVIGGAEIAKQTWNPRLGIVGGISILGTTGIVHPFSCAAWIASIHRGIDVIRAAGLAHAAACTGSTTEAAVEKRHHLPEIAFIDMGDFAGGVLKYLRHHPIPRLTLAGGFAKMAKLAEGHLDLHSGRSQVDLARIARRALDLGASADVAERIRAGNTAMEALEICAASGIPIGGDIARSAKGVALAEADGKIDIELLVYDRKGNLVGEAGFGS